MARGDQGRGLGRAIAAGLVAGAVAGAAEAAAPELSGFAGVELRVFPSAPKFPAQHDSEINPSFVLQPEWRWAVDARQRFTVIPFVRLDFDDDERTHFDMREANWLYDAGSWDLRVGLGKVFWGVAESRHLVDIMNQTDLVESPDEEDKLGQPMVNANVITDVGTFGVFVLPFFRERTFPGPAGRPGIFPRVAEDLARFESDADTRHIDVALRWQERVGPFDVGLAHFHGTGREPRFVPTLLPEGPVLVPHYDIIDQTSLDAQATLESWLLKVEAILRSGQGKTFFASVAGFEYTVFQVLGSPADLGLISEYHFDDRDETAPFTVFDNDLMLGARLGLNDVDDSSLLLGAIIDMETQSTFMTVEAQTRLGGGFRLEIEGRFFPYIANGDRESAFEREHFIELRLSRYF